MVAPDATDVTEPLSVILPDVVTVPDKDRPFAEPVPPTEVTVPVVELVPAPIALRKVAASRAETVLSALNRGNVIALGLTSVNTLAPTVVAPKLVRAPDAVVEPVPPLATGSVPETCVVRLTPESAPPRVSDPDDVTEPVSVIPLTVPVPATDVTVPAPRFVRAAAALVAPVPPFATASVPPRVRVPLPVIGPPESVRPVVPPDPETDVTVPPPAVDAMVIPPALFVTDMPEPAVSVAAV